MGVEVSQLSPLDKSALNSSVKSACNNNSTEETELKLSDSNFTEFSAKSKGMNAQGKLSNAAELIPRPVRDRKRPAKYNDFDTNFVRNIRASRLNTGKISQNTARRMCRIIWNSSYSDSD